MKEPIKNFSMAEYPKGSMTQGFGLNPALYARFDMKGHNGQDHVAPHGEPMFAIEDGEILDVKNTPEGYGKHVRFLSDDADNNLYREWTYGHCSEIFVVPQQKVKAGELIALMGNTGFVVSGATPFWKLNPFKGTHLHLGLRLMKRVRNGWTYPQSKIGIDCQNYDNGYKGSIDPTPYLIGVGDVTKKEVETQLQLTVISVLNALKKLLIK